MARAIQWSASRLRDACVIATEDDGQLTERDAVRLACVAIGLLDLADHAGMHGPYLQLGPLDRRSLPACPGLAPAERPAKAPVRQLGKPTSAPWLRHTGEPHRQ